MWLVVNFVEENSVEVVPMKWYLKNTNECFWPDSKMPRHKMVDIIRRCDDPLPTWIPYTAKILGEYDNFKTAEKKVNKAKDTDVLSSSTEAFNLGSRLKKKPKRFSNYSDTSENDSSEESDVEGYPKPPSPPVRLAEEVNQHKIFDNQIQPRERAAAFANTSQVLTEECQISRKDFEDFQREISRQLIIINTKLDDLSEALNLVLKNRQDEPITREIEDNLKNIIGLLPVKTQEDLNKVEDFLLDAGNNTAFYKFISLVGGNNGKDIIKRIMYKIFSIEMGCKFSWDGAKRKQKFKTLKLSLAIIEAVRLNPPTKLLTECEIINFIKLWLVRCPDRIEGGRKSMMRHE